MPVGGQPAALSFPGQMPPGGARAGTMGGGSVARPRWARILVVEMDVGLGFSRLTASAHARVACPEMWSNRNATLYRRGADGLKQRGIVARFGGGVVRELSAPFQEAQDARLDRARELRDIVVGQEHREELGTLAVGIAKEGTVGPYRVIVQMQS